MENKLGKRRKDAAPILFMVNRRFSDADMPKLFAAATHYWSLSHGEGWDLCLMEAGAAGLHLIAPDHSAYSSYLDSHIADLVPATRVPADFRWAHGLHKLFAGAEWWQPDEAGAVDCIQRAIRGLSGQANGAARDRFTKSFGWSHSSKRLIRLLSEFNDTSS